MKKARPTITGASEDARLPMGRSGRMAGGGIGYDGVMTVDNQAELPYAVHETFLGGMLGRLVSRHETLLEALAVATELSKTRAIVHRQQIVWPPPTAQS
jgi:hypothetical protein